MIALGCAAEMQFQKIRMILVRLFHRRRTPVMLCENLRRASATRVRTKTECAVQPPHQR